jgi:CBS domain-containing protein
VETAAISYRVVDFLKQHAPFTAIADEDLLALAGDGRVRFHEPNEYVLWQGEPHKPYVYVIQQGTVSLWDESSQHAVLRDVLGVGDMLGLERYLDARSCLYSARSESDTVLYGFAAPDFEAYVLKYPHAVQYVTASGQVTADYQAAGGRRDPGGVYVHEVAGRSPLLTCAPTETIAGAARTLLGSRSPAMAVVDEAHRLLGVLTPAVLLAWVAQGAGRSLEEPVLVLLQANPVVLRPDASVPEAVLTLGSTDAEALAVTSDGTPSSPLQMLVTSQDLAPVFGDQPTAILHAVRSAASVAELRDLNHRARAFTLEGLTGAASVEWLGRFTHLVDAAITARILALSGDAVERACWCFCASSGRGEALPMIAPHLLVILEDDHAAPAVAAIYRKVLDTLAECDYLPRVDLPIEPVFHAASAGEWQRRFGAWVTDPVLEQTYRARSLFDLRPVHGDRSLWERVAVTVMDTITREFVQVLANDCLASLPPLTFFEDRVLDSEGEHSTVFKLEHSALRPLVDVGRVFGLAAGQVMGRSTLERFAVARSLLPEHEGIFREAADTFRIVLWQQGRVGISQGSRGFELPPSLLGRVDRQVLKGGFRSIQRLLEFTADRAWIERL